MVRRLNFPFFLSVFSLFSFLFLFLFFYSSGVVPDRITAWGGGWEKFWFDGSIFLGGHIGTKIYASWRTFWCFLNLPLLDVDGVHNTSLCDATHKLKYCKLINCYMIFYMSYMMFYKYISVKLKRWCTLVQSYYCVLSVEGLLMCLCYLKAFHSFQFAV